MYFVDCVLVSSLCLFNKFSVDLILLNSDPLAELQVSQALRKSQQHSGLSHHLRAQETPT